MQSWLKMEERQVVHAIVLYENSQLVFWEQSRAMFLRNHAEKNGGAIFAKTQQ